MNSTQYSRDEFTRRTDRIYQALSARRLDAAVVTRPENIYYLSNFRASAIAAWTSRFHALVVPAQTAPRLLARSLESESANLQWTERPILWPDHEDPYQLVAEALGESDVPQSARIGIEHGSLTVRQFEELRRALPSTEFVDMSGVVETIAAELSPLEGQHMQRAAQVTDIGMRTALSGLKVGRHPYDVVGEIHQAMYAAGQSDFEKSFVAVWSGPKGGMMHDTRTTQRFRSGDIATIEIMGVDHQYLACAQTCVHLGEGPPPQDVVDAHEMVVAMHDAAKAAVRAGVTAGSIYAAANDVYRARVGKDYFRRVGGSMGLTLFAIDLVKDSAIELPVGTPLLVQTLVTEPVLLTCATTILVTEEGFANLTSVPRWDSGSSNLSVVGPD